MSAAEASPPGLELLHQAYALLGLASRRFTHSELWQLLGPLTDGARDLTRTEIGASAEGRPLYAIRFGIGPRRVLLWSQMHGDEPAHTMGLADLFSYFAREPDDARVRALCERLTVVAVPMLNPDGAERFRRLNAQGIDINRDAHAWLTPELRALRDLQAELRPDFALNLHDQDPRKRVGRSDRLTALALLANPFNEACDDNDARVRAKRLCVAIARGVEPLVGGHVARFQEEFNPQGSGEYVAASGTSTVLLECGGWPDDPEKQFLRSVSFVAILSALESIAHDGYPEIPLHEYEALEENGSSVFDVLVRGGTVVVPGLEPYRADLGIDFRAPFEREEGYVAEIGDLSDYAARETVDATGLYLHARPEALHGAGDARPVLGKEAWASFDLRTGPDPASEVVSTIRWGIVEPVPEARLAAHG